MVATNMILEAEKERHCNINKFSDKIVYSRTMLREAYIEKYIELQQANLSAAPFVFVFSVLVIYNVWTHCWQSAKTGTLNRYRPSYPLTLSMRWSKLHLAFSLAPTTARAHTVTNTATKTVVHLTRQH